MFLGKCVSLDFEAECKERLLANKNKENIENQLSEVHQTLLQLQDENLRLKEEINSQGNERLQELRH